MVGYGESMLLITDKPFEQSEFLFDTLVASKNINRNKVFQEYKNEWFRSLIWHGNYDVCDEDFYRVQREILEVRRVFVSSKELEYYAKKYTNKPYQELLDILAKNQVYSLDGGHFQFLYNTKFDYSEYKLGEQKICTLRQLCSKEIVARLIEYIKERIDKGSKINKLVYCTAGLLTLLEIAEVDCKWIDMDIDTVKIPEYSAKYFNEEFNKRGVEFRGYDFGINFYKGSK